MTLFIAKRIDHYFGFCYTSQATLRDPLTVLKDDFGYFLPRDFESNFCLSSVQFFIAVAFSKGTIESLVFVQSQVSTNGSNEVKRWFCLRRENRRKFSRSRVDNQEAQPKYVTGFRNIPPKNA